MTKRYLTFCAVLPLLGATALAGGEAPKPAQESAAAVTDRHFTAEEVRTSGSVTINGARLDYQAIAGTLVVHPRDWDDVPRPADEDKKAKESDKNADAEAAMSFVAYMKSGADAASRPVTFIFNGGPGSATVWLHMGAFGPKRVLTAEDSHTPAAPYKIVNNDQSILDASDLVFIDAPGTGFGRIAGENKEAAFWSVDADAYAFSEFITQFLSKYGRWNSPKYLFGESYGTTRAAVLVNQLQNERDVDVNGVIMLSQILNFDLSPDGPDNNPGIDLPYQLALPTYAATAWYHKKLPGYQGGVRDLLNEVETFALTDYALALQAGSSLGDEQRQAIAERLQRYTGLPVAYILKADLRIDGGEFEKSLQDDTNTTTGRLDTRFSGPTIDPLSKDADYDPQSSAISSAYVSAYNHYIRTDLRFGEGKRYKPSAGLWRTWNFLHQPPGEDAPVQQAANVMPDLAMAMKTNPNLRVQLHAGYYDLATPYFEGIYEMKHLAIPRDLQKNISYVFYESGHMVYAHEESLKMLHDTVAAFIDGTDNIEAPADGP
ncbi:MAG: peptidase S10 [Alphaproteobacteria bacterium]|nr:peptidase S10 [Alphaproteobacteria bacterium]